MLKSFYQETLTEAGVDEAGRGCFAGPVFAAAVILPPDFSHPLLNDSKLLKPAQRELLRKIIEKEAISYNVSRVDEGEIDRINILKASIKAMHQSIEKLDPQPGLLLIDGNRFYSFKKIPHRCIVKGDSQFASIAAASILAKTHRDEYMLGLHRQFPQYNWAQNKGYGTAEHRQVIREIGLCKYHRKSFRLLSESKNLI